MVADEQLHAKAFFQALDRRRNGRLGDVQLARGLGDAARLHRGDEILELSQGIGSHRHLFGAVWALWDYACHFNVVPACRGIGR
ncbi:hypothetical protein D3C81_1707940 [compost metagenome]